MRGQANDSLDFEAILVSDIAFRAFATSQEARLGRQDSQSAEHSRQPQTLGFESVWSSEQEADLTNVWLVQQ